MRRIAAGVLAGLDEVATHAESPLWRRAMAATRAVAEAPQHRIRSQLVLIGDLAGGGRGQGAEVEELAVGLELLHLFMLIHDDVIDSATMRRGRPSVHAAVLAEAPALGRDDARSLAVVVGNLLHVMGMERVVRSDPAGAATRLLLDASRRTGVGQFGDVEGWRGLRGGQGAASIVDRQRFLALMEDKSAYQSFAAPLAAGLLRARPDADAGALLSWGRRMGVALQALDDLTDLVGDPRVTGKDGLRDIVEGRLSLAVLVLLERAATDEDQRFLRGLLGAHAIMPADRQGLEELIERHEVVSACRGFIAEEIGAARAIADGAGLPGAAREALAAMEAGLGEAVGQVG